MKKKWKFTKKAACKAARFLSLLITLFVLQWTCSIGLPGGILVGRPALSGPSPPTSSTTRLVKKEDKSNSLLAVKAASRLDTETDPADHSAGSFLIKIRQLVLTERPLGFLNQLRQGISVPHHVHVQLDDVLQRPVAGGAEIGDLLLSVAQKAPVIRWLAAKRAHAGLIFKSEYKISVHMYLQSR